jgi:hypothetical protein
MRVGNELPYNVVSKDTGGVISVICRRLVEAFALGDWYMEWGKGWWGELGCSEDISSGWIYWNVCSMVQYTYSGILVRFSIPGLKYLSHNQATPQCYTILWALGKSQNIYHFPKNSNFMLNSLAQILNWKHSLPAHSILLFSCKHCGRRCQLTPYPFLTT